MMWPFKKKKIYKVEYEDRWGAYGCSIVKANNEAQAWSRAIKIFNGTYQATVCINITELKDA